MGRVCRRRRRLAGRGPRSPVRFLGERAAALSPSGPGRRRPGPSAAWPRVRSGRARECPVACALCVASSALPPLRPVPTCAGTLSAGSGRPRLPRVRHDGSRPLAPWGGNVGAWRPLCFCSGAQRAEATQPRSPVASCPPSRRFSLSLDWGKPAAWSLSGREFGGPRWFGRR